VRRIRVCVLNKRDTSSTLTVVAETARDLRSAGPARGVLRAPSPDGRLGTMRVLPSARLAPFVHHFGSVRWSLRTPFEAEALPHPSVQIVLEKAGGRCCAAVAGVPNARVAKVLVGEGHAFRITFRPAMFQPILGAPVASITDGVLRARDVFGPNADRWARTVLAEPDLARKIAIVEAFLEPLLLHRDPEAVRFRDLVERMATDRALLRVEDVAEIAGLDVRALQRSFRVYVGVSPKWIIRRYRLHEAAERLKAKRPQSLAALAASLDYADQSHFAREFKFVIGQTPRSFAAFWR
jgi:AraC-like DNA-binding protein